MWGRGAISGEDGGLGERPALVEAGPVLGTELQASAPNAPTAAVTRVR